MRAGTVVEPVDTDDSIPIARTQRSVLRQLLRDRTAMVGVLIVTLFGLAAIIGPVLEPHDPNNADVLSSFASPSTSYPLGTDELGRDELSRLLYGARLSIGTAIFATIGIALVGLAMGTLAGYFGGTVDGAIGWVIDILLAFPTFLLALAVTGILGPSLRNVMVAVISVWWAGYARIVRGAILAEREKQYVQAVRAVGSTDWAILRRHLLPNIVAPIVVLTTLDMGAILLGISALSFLGLGVSPPTAEWGAMLSEGRTYLSQDANLMLFPGLAIFLMVLGFNLVGDGLRDVLDPRLQPGRRR
jgi:peptide/nickel transport system permease protein